MPWVTIKNTGAPTSFNIKFSIQDPNDKWYQGACWPTGVLNHGEEKVVWPCSVQITSSMPDGAYNAKVELFADYCVTDKLTQLQKTMHLGYISSGKPHHYQNFHQCLRSLPSPLHARQIWLELKNLMCLLLAYLVILVLPCNRHVQPRVL